MRATSPPYVPNEKLVVTTPADLTAGSEFVVPAGRVVVAITTTDASNNDIGIALTAGGVGAIANEVGAATWRVAVTDRWTVLPVPLEGDGATLAVHNYGGGLRTGISYAYFTR